MDNVTLGQLVVAVIVGEGGISPSPTSTCFGLQEHGGGGVAAEDTKEALYQNVPADAGV